MSVIKCLLQKAEAGLVSRKTADSIIQEIESLKTKAAGGADVTRELEAAQAAFDTISNRLTQKARQTAIHANLVESGAARFKEGVPADVTMKSFSFDDEANGYRYGYLGPSAYERVKHNQRIFTGMAVDILDNLNPKRVGLFRDPKTHYEIKKDMFAALQGKGTRSDNPDIRAITDQITDLTTKGAQAFERAGGNITLRNDYMLGRSINKNKILAADKADYIKDSVQAYDLEKVKEATGGAIQTPDDLAKAAAKDYDAIASGGIVDLADFAPPGMKSVVNSRNHHRIFHFKDADTMQMWQDKYGDENLYQQVVSYADKIGKDIGILETYGPKPEAFIRSMLRNAAEQDPARAAKLKDKAYQQFRFVTGQWDKSLDPTLQKWLTTYRQTNVASMLGLTTLDAATIDAVGVNGIAMKMRGLPALKSIAETYKRVFTSGIENDTKEWARLGWLSESFVDDALQHLRASEAEGGHKLSRELATGTMKWTGLTRWTNASKGTATKVLGETLANVDLEAMPKELSAWLGTHGVNKEYLQKLRDFGTEEIENWKGVKVISPIKLYNAGMTEEAATVGALFNRVQELASPTSSPEIRAWFSDFERGGTARQLIAGSMKTFTGYNGSFYHNHLRTLAAMPGMGNKLKWTAAFATSLIAASTVSTMLRDMATGKSPVLNAETVMRAIGRANIVPYLGDFLLSRGVQFGADMKQSLTGVLFDNINTAGKAITQAVHGNASKALGETQKLLENFIPGKNAWFAGLALKRTILDQLHYLYDPQAAKKFKASAARSAKAGTPFWWAPGELTPDHAPDLNNLTEQPFFTPPSSSKKGKDKQ